MNPIQIGYTILALVVAIALIGVGLLVGGVIDANTADVFGNLNLTGSKWDQMRQTAINYAQQGINIVLVSIILTALGILLAVIFGFVGGINKSSRVAQFVEVWVARFRNVLVFVCRIGNYIVAAAARIGNVFVQATAI